MQEENLVWIYTLKFKILNWYGIFSLHWKILCKRKQINEQKWCCTLHMFFILFYVAVLNLSANWFCFYNLFQPNVIGNYIDPWWYKSPPPQPGQRSRSATEQSAQSWQKKKMFVNYHLKNSSCIVQITCCAYWPFAVSISGLVQEIHSGTWWCGWTTALKIRLLA